MPRRVITPGKSCLECRRRKIKCDRSVPCGYCVRTRVQCAYPPPREHNSADSRGDGDLTGRVEELERALQSLEERCSRTGDPRTGDLRLTTHRSEEEYQLNPHVETGAPTHRGRSTIHEQGESHFPFHLRLSPYTERVHPPPAVIAFLWQTYLDTVDPVIKMFHVPTLQREIVGVIRRQLSPDKQTECVMLAIYYSAVVTMTADDCRRELHEDKGELLKRYRSGVENALSSANFLKSLDIPVLQAFVLYLICGRRDENGPDVHTLVGIAIGTAMRIGLHCEGASMGISAFEREMRRRLWWQICTLDVRTAEDNGSEPSIPEIAFSTRLPSNVNDVDLDPDMSDLPQNVSGGRTEMLFTLVRFEVSHFARRVVFSDTFCRTNSYPVLGEKDKCEAVNSFQRRIEEQYLSFCDKGIAFDYVTVASTRLILVKLKLGVCKPRPGRNPGTPVGPNYYKVCEEVLRHANSLRQYNRGRRWLWLFQTYIEWDALAYLLVAPHIGPSGATPSTPAAGRVVEEVYEYWKNDGDARKDSRWEQIEELRSQTLALRDRMRGVSHTPGRSTHSPGVSHPGSPGDPDPASIPAFHDGRRVAVASDGADVERPPPSSYLPHVPTEECDPSMTGSLPLVPSLASSSTPAAIDLPVENGHSEQMELPGAGTACEWSAALFERYWDITGSGQGTSVTWL